MEDDARLVATSQTTDMDDHSEGTGRSLPFRDTQPSQTQTSNLQHTQDQQNMSVSSAASPLDMSNVATALPDYMYRQVSHPMYQQQYSHHTPNSHMMYSWPQPQYTAPMPGPYGMSFSSQTQSQAFSQQRQYGAYPVNQTMSPPQQVFHGQPLFAQQPPLSPSQMQPYGQPPFPMYGTRVPNPYHVSPVSVDNFHNTVAAGQPYSPNEFHDIRRTSSSTSLQVPSALRGPPRKPKQSGHALWVGNLPPGANIIDLTDHFSRDATEDIESVFLISKSNCAFVNYRSEESCTAAMGRFHDSRFHGVRLVCRLRRGSNPSSTATPPTTNVNSILDPKVEAPSTLGQTTTKEELDEEANREYSQIKRKFREKYFIIKSLTVEDLHRSVQSGIWATQSHNEEALNKAFETTEDVYLIFSANKSGEYFGYARMDSAIDAESAAAMDISTVEAPTLQQPSSSSIAELPLTIPTPATATAPKGYIIDDSARGTIFWEAELTTQHADHVGVGNSPANTDSGDVSGEDISDPQSQSLMATSSSTTSTYGKPFKITWLSTDKLPFYRTRGLRNPWNTNREVKIARDGTELEPGVGRKLVSMFNPGVVTGRAQQPNQYLGPMVPIPGQGPAYRPF